jgi:hypothetical protein
MLLDLKLFAQPPHNVGVFLSAWCYWYVTAKDFRYVPGAISGSHHGIRLRKLSVDIFVVASINDIVISE